MPIVFGIAWIGAGLLSVAWISTFREGDERRKKNARARKKSAG